MVWGYSLVTCLASILEALGFFFLLRTENKTKQNKKPTKYYPTPATSQTVVLKLMKVQEASLVCRATSRTTKVTTQRNPVPKNKTNQIKTKKTTGKKKTKPSRKPRAPGSTGPSQAATWQPPVDTVSFLTCGCGLKEERGQVPGYK